MNVTPTLERLLKSLECTAELETARNEVEIATGCKKWLSIYTRTLRHAGESWKGFNEKFDEVCNRFGFPFGIFLFKIAFFLQMEGALRKFKNRETVLAAANNEQTTETVNCDAIIRSMINQFEPHSIGYIDNGDLQNCFSSATVLQITADEMVTASIFWQNAVNISPKILFNQVDFHIGPDELIEAVDADCDATMQDVLNRTTEVENRKKTMATEGRASLDFGSVEPCRHHNELKRLQLQMNNNLDEFACYLETLRPINDREAPREIPRRFNISIQSIFAVEHPSPAFESVALGKFSQKIMARDEQHAEQILRDFEGSHIKSIDLILQVDLVQKGDICAPENRGRGIPLSEMEEEHIRNILSKYVLCDGELDAAALADEYPSKIVIFSNGKTLNNLRMMECGHSDAFNILMIRVYCLEHCINFCKVAVVELPQIYWMATCLPLNERDGRDASALQCHHEELHEQYVKRTASKWRVRQVFDTKKKIEWVEIEIHSSLFRTRNFHLVSVKRLG